MVLETETKVSLAQLKETVYKLKIVKLKIDITYC